MSPVAVGVLGLAEGGKRRKKQTDRKQAPHSDLRSLLPLQQIIRKVDVILSKQVSAVLLRGKLIL